MDAYLLSKVYAQIRKGTAQGSHQIHSIQDNVEHSRDQKKQLSISNFSSNGCEVCQIRSRVTSDQPAETSASSRSSSNAKK